MPRSVLGLRANAFTANGDDSGHVLYAAWTLPHWEMCKTLAGELEQST